MCGIAGRFSSNGALLPESQREIANMTRRLAHRGPDGEGILDRSPVAVLGHRRLAIIDVAQGHQPMEYADGRLWITFNGEIYNYRDLRERLLAKGHVFRTNSDTEVILAAYAEWGDRCVEELDGMFAFAVLDLPERRLFLARDPVGKKPLYFRWRRGVFDFASELGALALAADWEGQLDPEGLAFHLRLQYIPSPWTAFRGVEKLRPGECCTVDASGLHKRQYWQPAPNRFPAPANVDVAVEQLQDLLREAVRRRLMSEVPLGAFLSAGIDSGLVVALMAELCGPGVKTATVGFADEPGGGEIEGARSVADRYATDHQEITVRADAADVLDRMVAHFGEPFADASAVALWSIAKATRQRVTVALSGDGGDEPFGGYDFRYVPHRRDARARRLVPAAIRRSLFGPLRSLPRALRAGTFFRNLRVEEDEAFYLDLCFTSPELAAGIAPELAVHEATVAEHVRSIYRSSAVSDPLTSIMLADVRLYMTEDVLVKVDRMSMAHGLEVRCPFLSKRVIDFAFSLPSRMKVDGRISKAVVRRLARRLLPHSVVDLPKRGFHVPLDAWFRSGLRERFDELVLDSKTVEGIGLDPTHLRKIWREHRDGTRNHGHTLWTIAVLAAWRQQLGSSLARPSTGPSRAVSG